MIARRQRDACHGRPGAKRRFFARFCLPAPSASHGLSVCGTPRPTAGQPDRTPVMAGCYIATIAMIKPPRTTFTPLAGADFSAAFPNSRKVHVDGPDVRVPFREIALTNGETLRVYDTSGPQNVDVHAGLPSIRELRSEEQTYELR